MWAQTFGRQGDDEGRGLAMDGEGRAIVVGTFVDGMALGDEIPKETGLQDILVLRLDR